MNNHRAVILRTQPLRISGLIVFCVLFIVNPLFASNFPTEPILRLNPEGHFSTIRCIDIDAEGQYLVSGSIDKTVKVWRLKDGTLERTLRPPQSVGPVGKIYAVAISPDGTEVAAGGWTGPSGEHFIFIFDRGTGKLKHCIAGLPNVVNHLAYSPDGKYLVACLGLSNGIRVYRTPAYREEARDTDYGKESYDVDFAADSRLVTGSFDGKIRIYSPQFKLLKVKEAPGGKQIFGVAFSPDGTRIAVGYDDNNHVDVLDSQTLARLYAVDTSEVDNGNISTVAWSPDGETLLAGGTYDVSTMNPICSWSQQGRGPFRNDLLITNQTIMTLHPLADGRLTMGGANSIVVLDPSDKIIWSKFQEIADFRGQTNDNGIRLSHAGDLVAFGYELWGERPARFSLKDLTLTVNPEDIEELALPDEEPKMGLKITDWENTYNPKLNDRPLSIEEFETSRSLAISPDGKGFILGAEWNLYSFSRNGDQLWKESAPGIVWAVNITRDGRYVAAGYGDGTIRWHRMTDGVEVLAFFPHPDGKRWVLWTPNNFYQASAGGEDLIGWHINRGDETESDFFGASRFRGRFYRPDVIARVLKAGDIEEALRLADEARGLKTRTRSIAESLPPTIEILSPAPKTPVESIKLPLFYHARSSDLPITRVEARIDGRPAKVLNETIPESQRGKKEWLAQITIQIPPQDATVELIAFNKNGAGPPASFLARWTGGTDYYKPNLFALAVGISKHPVKNARLKWAAKDAQDFVETLKAQEGGLYKKVSYRLLPDDKATRDEIRRGLNWLRKETNPRDVAIVFLAGHGFRNEFGDYYFLPYDGRPEEAELSSVSGDDFRQFLRTISGKTVLFLDTCYSGGLRTGARGETDSLPDIARFANELADAEAGVIVFASSTGKQISIEDDTWENGAFTEALLEGLRGKADYTKDFFLFVSELETYLTDRVNELTGKQQKPMTTKPKAAENYRLLRVIQ